MWTSTAGGDDAELMPAWGPPTPPAADGDVYRESWAGALYRPGAAPDALLPVAARREPRARPSPRARPAPRQPHAPLSLFARGASSTGGAGARQRTRAPPLAHTAPPPAPDWTAAEDAALRRALRLQRLPPEPPPALAPNWEWCGELVAEPARVYRSARACRDRHEALQDPERARRRRQRHAPPRRRAETADPLQRLDAVRRAAERRRALPRRRPEEAPPRNPKHAAMLAEHGVDYEAPPLPVDVATRRADRIAREKLKASAPPSASAPAPTVPPAPAPTPPRPPAPPVLYRQQSFPARHLKILHQAPTTPHAQSGSLDPAPSPSPSPAPAPPAAAGAVRKLQLQQLALRRATSAPSAPPQTTAPPAPPHVLVAHLAPPRAPDTSRQ